MHADKNGVYLSTFFYNQNVEIGEATDTVNYSSSGAVFKKIQEEVQKEINEKAGRTAVRRRDLFLVLWLNNLVDD